MPAGPGPRARLTEDELKAHPVIRALLRVNAPKGIKVSAKREYWNYRDDYESLPGIVTGEINRWISKKDYTVSIDWYDGRDTEDLRARRHHTLRRLTPRDLELPRASTTRVACPTRSSLRTAAPSSATSACIPPRQVGASAALHPIDERAGY